MNAVLGLLGGLAVTALLSAGFYAAWQSQKAKQDVLKAIRQRIEELKAENADEMEILQWEAFLMKVLLS